MTLILSGTDGLSDIDGSAATPAVRGTDANTGIFFPAADTIAFAEGGVEAMRIDSGGSVRINNTSNATFSAQLNTQFASAFQCGQYLKVTDTSASQSMFIFGNSSSDAVGSIATSGSATSYNTSATSGIIGLDASTIAINTASSERMRIASSGNVGIGTTDTSLFNSVGGSTRLAVCGSSASTDILGNTGASISIINTDTTANNTAGLHFARADTDDTPNYAGASIVAQFPDTQVASQYPKGLLSFLTSTTANAAPSEKMRIDSSGNLLFNSGYGSVATAYGCRAWVNFNGTGTVAIRASGNVSSITDNGTGDYTVNFTTAMPDNEYAFTQHISCTTGALDDGCDLQSIATGSFRVRCGNGGTSLDANYAMFSIFR